MLSLKNILNCTVIEDFDEDTITSLKKGANNVIIHEGLLWVPNMYSNACKTAHVKKVNKKEDILPQTAPIEKLKAYDAKLDEFMEGYSERERHNFLKRLVDGVGFAGHYNRHRFKMPDDFFDPSSKV